MGVTVPLILFACTQSSGPPEQPSRFTIIPPLPKEVGEQLTEVITYTIDARSTTEWTYFDFSRGSTVEIWGRRSLNWDLAFQRNKIISNSGLTNPEGNGGIVELSSADFESVTEAPEEGYVTDTKTRDRIETENKAIVRWFDYSYTANTLKPKKSVYIIRTADGKYARMKILHYYCEGHISGCLTIQYVYQGNGSRKFVNEQAVKVAP